jgi:glutathione synthase/RimK-type ligase-like ATP-grasp enzyme
MNLAIAACAEFADLDDGWPPVQVALAEAGCRAQVVTWDDPQVDWGRFDLVAVMYTWGYVTQREAFLAWAESVEAVTGLANSAAHLRWNSDKTHLRELAARGIPVVPTTWARPGQPWEPPAGDYVIKPTVASGGLGAARFRAGRRDAADAHVRRLHQAGQTVMVQPYQGSVDVGGETALVFLGDRFSHAATKSGLLVTDVGETDRLWEREVITPAEAAPGARRLAEIVMGAVIRRLGPVAYARVDLVDDAQGRPQVLEVELVEPSLFLATAEGSAQRLADVLRHLVAYPSG